MTALYLKYRPQSLEQIIGQVAVKKTLIDAYSSNKLSHAYLLVGPRGTGKTSTARILAKMVNCESNASLIPCNSCATCLSITDGTSLDLIEIDAASNRGIDDIRALRETINLTPTSAKKKVYIIDEVHMLTVEAFNALLKTLEEPPEHAFFILATTEIGKIPKTILSRVQRLDFKIASLNELIESLKVVISGEKIKIEEDALIILAKKADGSFRDGVKFLDQLGGQITLKDVSEKLTLADFEIVANILKDLAKKDSKAILNQIVQSMQFGVNPKDLALSILENLRAIFYIKNGLGEKLIKEEIGSDKYQVLTEIAENFSTQELTLCLDLLQNALEKMKIASILSLPLEIAVVEICGQPQPVEITKPQIDKAPIPNIPKADLIEIDIPELTKIKDKWVIVLETIRQDNFSLEALLRNVKLKNFSDGIVSIEVPYAFHQRILEQPKSRNLLEAVLSDVLQEPVKVATSLGERPQRLEDIANVEIAAEDEIINMASEIFNGKLVD